MGRPAPPRPWRSRRARPWSCRAAPSTTCSTAIGRLRDALLSGLAHELRRLTGHVEELHFLDLAGRLAMRLFRLAREADKDAQEVRLDWPYTQSDLASMIGGTRQSVNKLLSGLVDDGLVVIERDTLIVTDVDALGGWQSARCRLFDNRAVTRMMRIIAAETR